MTRPRAFLALALLLVAGGGIVAWLAYRAAQPLQFTLRLHPYVGGAPLELNAAHYANPGGAGTFTVRDFQFFLSNVRLVADSGEFREPDSYHLVRFDGDTPVFEIVLKEVPRADYRRIDFGIGVDPKANGSIESLGDLDPNGRMAWSWEVGYKFVLIEGGLVVGDQQYPLVYHVGFNENYKQLSIGIDPSEVSGNQATLDFRADLLRMFTGKTVVDMANLSNVKFDRGDAKRLADNYARMVSLCPADPRADGLHCGDEQGPARQSARAPAASRRTR